MADNRQTTQAEGKLAPGEPVLRQGRAADPVPAAGSSSVPSRSTGASGSVGKKASEADSESGPTPEMDSRVASAEEPPVEDSPDNGSREAESPAAIEQAMAESLQRKLRLMLKQCDRVLLMDFDILAMSRWPDNYSLATARRSRDLWLFSALVAALVFLSGLTGFIPAWVAGGGFGAFVIILMLGVPAIRRIYTSRPSYLDLIVTRQRLLRDARKHIEHLEGKEGLVWQCARMAEFNPALRASRFSELLALSEHRTLARNMTRREYVRLYLIYLLEAEKAYDRVQKAFFEGNQQAIDRGWASVAASPGQRA
ncbi:hypothetical protein EHN06_13005 [Marinobacter sp. NP-4(2019)]|uniref:hypothetical protein n=1 Tax=Marinobacter sp. NP-4(2019) TaxID=2488665 RepID=UPI000FC3EE12|nr:hypothetical protein [Marinobacter sp. NP-4(2019)]AZT84380.1 hypothetical protein EHN06_13005 [Marinobacter sp. NP-4(2019)]